MKRFSSLRRIGILLLVLTLVMGLAISASAATMTQDGVKVTVTPDKDKYEANEKIKPDIKVENLNDFDIKDVKVEVTVPSGYEVSGDKSVTYATVKAGEGKQPAVTIAAKPVVTPSTGDTTPIFLWGGLLFLAAALLIGMFVFFRKGNMKFLSVFLAVVMVVGMIPVAAFAADVTKSMTLIETVTVGTKKADITVKVTYTIPDQGDDDPTEGTEPGEGTTAGTTAGTTEPTTGNTTAPTTGGDVDLPDVEVPEDVTALYVSVKAEAGKGNGTIDNPYANMNEAKAAIRKIKDAGEYPEDGITVYFREGTYFVLETILLEEADSGEEGAPIVYKAYNDEKVEFVGGVSIDASAFKPVTDTAILNRLADKTNVKQLDLKAMGINDYGQMNVFGYCMSYFGMAGIKVPTAAPPELFFNDDVMSVAKYPNDGWLKTATVIETGDVIQNWTAAAQGNDYIPPEDRPDTITGSTFTVRKAEWERMERWTEAKDIWVYGFWKETWADQSMPVEYIEPSTGTVKTVYPSGKEMKVGKDFYFYNLLEEIDVPGEYYIDRDSGILYAYLPSETGTITYGSLSGSTIQFGERSHDIEIVGIDFTAGRDNGIYMTGAKRIIIKDSEMCKFAEQAIFLQDCTDITITGCHIYDTGTGGISASYDATRQPYLSARRTLEPMGIVVEHCEIHDYDRINKTYSGAVSTAGVGMIVRNCKIYNATHYAISLGGNDTLIENNEIFNVLQSVDDSGAIYNGFAKQAMGQVVRNNFFHDIGSSVGTDVNCIYMDDTKDGVTFESNLLVNIGGTSALVNGGWDNNVRNNIMVNVYREAYLSCIGMAGSTRYDVATNANYAEFRNIYNAGYEAYKKYPHWEGKLEAVLASNSPKYNLIENNILVNVKNPTFIEQRQLWTAEQTLAQNTVKAGHTFTLDEIGFVDYENGDFNLKEDSPLFDIEGFVAPDFSKMGQYYKCEKTGDLNQEETPDDDLTDFTGTLFEEDFTDPNALDSWTQNAPAGVSAEVNSSGQLEISAGGVGTIDYVARLDREFAGIVTYELDFKLELNGCTSANIDPGIIIVKGKSATGAGVTLVGLKAYAYGLFGAYDGGGGTSNTTYWSNGRTYKVQVVCNSDTDTYDFYIDGKPVITGGKLLADAACFTALDINIKKTAEGPAAKFTYDNIRVVTGDATKVEEDDNADDILYKEIFTESDALNAWALTTKDGNPPTAVKNGVLEVIMDGKTKIDYDTWFEEACDGKVTYVMDYTVKLNGSRDLDPGIIIAKGKNDKGAEKSIVNLKLFVDKNTGAMTFGAYDGDGEHNTTVPAKEGQTYRITFIVDPDTDTYTYYADDVLVIENGKLRSDAGNVTTLTGIRLTFKNNEADTAPVVTYDNITVYAGAKLPSELIEPLYKETFTKSDALNAWALTTKDGNPPTAVKNGVLEVIMDGKTKIDYDTWFEEAYEGKVTYELDYTVKLNGSRDLDPGIIIAKGKNDKGAEKSIVNLKLFVDKNTGAMTFGAYDGDGEHNTTVPAKEGKTYRITFIVDPATDTYTYYANGKLVIENGKLRSDAGNVVSLTGVRLTFVNKEADTAPVVTYDNIVVWPGEVLPKPETPVVLYSNDFAGEQDGVLKMTSGIKSYTLDEPYAEKVAIEYKIKVVPESADFKAKTFFQCSAPCKTFANVGFKNGKVDLAGSTISGASYSNDTWHKVKIIADPDAQTYDVYLNGTRIKEGAAYVNNVNNVWLLYLQVESGTGAVYFDDLTVSTVVEGYNDIETPDTDEPGTDEPGTDEPGTDTPDTPSDPVATVLYSNNFASEQDGVLKMTSGIKSYTLDEAYAGKVAIEYKIKVVPESTDFKAKAFFQCSAPCKTFANVGFKNGKIDLAGSSVSGVSYSNDTWHKVKIVADPDVQKYDVYLDGTLIKEGAAYVNNVNNVWLLYLQVESGTGAVYFDDLTVSTVVDGDDSTDTDTPGTDEPGTDTPSDPVATVLYSNNFASEQNGVLTLTSGTLPLGIGEAYDGKVTVEYKTKVVAESNDFAPCILVRGAEGTFAKVIFSGGKVGLGNGLSTRGTYTDDTWYTVKIVADPATKLFEVYLDGILITENRSYNNPATNINAVYFQIGSGTGTAYFDDLTVSTFVANDDTTGDGTTDDDTTDDGTTDDDTTGGGTTTTPAVTTGLKALVMGDSLTSANKWQQKLVDELGMIVTTHAKGGLSMKQIVDGYDTHPALSADLVKDKDLIIFYAGYNNRYHALGSATDTGTAITVAGYLQYSIDTIRSLLAEADNTDCRIIIVTPHCVGQSTYGPNGHAPDGYTPWPSSGVTLEDLCNMMLAVAEANNIPAYDLFHNSGIGKTNWNDYSMQVADENGYIPGTTTYADQVHLNSAGHALIGSKIADFILDVYSSAADDETPGTDEPGTDTPDTDEPGTEEPGTDDANVLLFDDFSADTWNFASVFTGDEWAYELTDDGVMITTTSTNKQKAPGKAVSTNGYSKISIEWNFKVQRGSSKILPTFLLSSDKGTMLNVGAQSGDFVITDGGSGESFNVVYNFKTGAACVDGQSYKLKLVIDFNTDTYDLYIDDQLVLGGRKLRLNANYLNYISMDIKENSGTEAKVWFDNLKVQAIS